MNSQCVDSHYVDSHYEDSHNVESQFVDYHCVDLHYVDYRYVDSHYRDSHTMNLKRFFRGGDHRELPAFPARRTADPDQTPGATPGPRRLSSTVP